MLLDIVAGWFVVANLELFRATLAPVGPRVAHIPRKAAYTSASHCRRNPSPRAWSAERQADDIRSSSTLLLQ